MKEAAENWVFLDSFPRCHECSPGIYSHKNSLVFKNISNFQWIYGALMVRLLKCYKHETDEPPFDDFESAYKKPKI